MENTLAPMASTPPAVATPADKAKKALDISSLMSPPEPSPYDNFPAYSPSSTALAAGPGPGASGMVVVAAKPPMPMSPPVSPFSKATQPVDLPPTPASSVKDPILYPTLDGGAGSSASGSPPPPLFVPADLMEVRRIVDRHVASRPAGYFRGSSPPRRQDYELALAFRSQVMRRYTENPQAWLKKEREMLLEDRMLRRKHGRAGAGPKYPTLLPASKPAPIRAPRTHRPEKVTKPASTSAAGAARPMRTNPTPQRQAARVRVSATPDEPRRTVAPNREDKDFGALPDYCPPLDSLPPKANSLKVDWKGAPIDLSGDANMHLLHPDEVSLAANLRLDCATYLTSKRRIFVRRLECARVGKEFRKTDAQQACKIDVNKASKLWTAFEKVGWLNIDWMRDHLRGTGSEHVARN
jgi:hypothetical protein